MEKIVSGAGYFSVWVFCCAYPLLLSCVKMPLVTASSGSYQVIMHTNSKNLQIQRATSEETVQADDRPRLLLCIDLAGDGS